LDKDWVGNIIKPFANKKISISSGYYIPVAKNIFQKSLSAYTSVMLDKVDKDSFLPSSRSVAFRKKAWEKVKGYPEELNTCEDLIFDKRLKDAGFKFEFAGDAIVLWPQRNNLREAFKQFFNYATGDGLARYFRVNTPFLFLRYIFAVYLILLSLVERSIYLYGFIFFCFLLYVAWSIWKNYRYVDSPKAIVYLPLLQFSSDIAVICGTILGFIQSLSLKSFFQVFSNNKGAAFVIGVYILTMLSVISYGIPGPSHPFNYFMDEWHQSQSVRNLFKYGTPNIAGSANGSIFQFFLTGIYLIPFYVFHIVNPFLIKSSVLNLDLQTRLFEVLRLNTLVWGVMSICIVSYIARKYFRVNSFLSVFIFVVNPIWLMLSNYYKYDIALMFWILLSFLFFLKYAERPNFINFLLAGIFSALAMSVKLLSPLPLFITYILMFFIFTPNYIKKLKYLVIGIFVYILVYLFFGNPDILLGKGSLFTYIYSNVIQAPTGASNFVFGMNYWEYYLKKLYPAVFGHLFYILFLFSLFYGLIFLFSKEIFKKTKEIIYTYRNQALLCIAFLTFSASLYLIKTEATNNRVLVLLPFMALSVVSFINSVNARIINKLPKFLFVSIMFLALSFQTLETLSWLPMKLSTDPRLTASYWIVKNIQKGTLIGIENIPIYQHLPDVIVREFYNNQYDTKTNTEFSYEIINSNSKHFPKTIIISNDDLESKYLRQSEKKNLLIKLNNLGYKKIIVFTPDFRYYKTFNSELTYYMSGLIQAPNTISIYEKL